MKLCGSIYWLIKIFILLLCDFSGYRLIFTSEIAERAKKNIDIVQVLYNQKLKLYLFVVLY